MNMLLHFKKNKRRRSIHDTPRETEKKKKLIPRIGKYPF